MREPLSYKRYFKSSCPTWASLRVCVIATFLSFFCTCVYAQEVKNPDIDLSYIRDVESLINQGNLSDAKQLVLSRMSNNRDDGYAYYYLAKIYLYNDKFEEVIQTIETALKYLTESDTIYIAESHYLKSKALFELEHYEDIIPEMNSAISIRPEFSDYLVLRGVVYMYLDDYDNAEIDFRCALTYESTNPEALLGIAMIKKYSGQYDSAVKTLNRVISADKNYSLAYVIRSSIYYEMGEVEKACDDVIKALEIDDSDDAKDYLLVLANNNYSVVHSKLESKVKSNKQKWQPYLDMVESITDTNEMPAEVLDLKGLFVDGIYGDDAYQDVIPDDYIDHSKESIDIESIVIDEDPVEPEPTEDIFEVRYTVSNGSCLFNDVQVNHLKTRLFFEPSQRGFRIAQSQATQLFKLLYFDERSISFPRGNKEAKADFYSTGKIPVGSVITIKSLIIGDLELTDVKVNVVQNEGVAFSMGGSDIPSISEIEDDSDNNTLIFHRPIDDSQTEELLQTN